MMIRSLKCSICVLLCLLTSWGRMGVGVAHAQVNTDNVILMGRNALSVDDYLGAIRLFTAVIESKPHLQPPYYYRAYAKFSLEDYQGAEADCSTSLALNPYITDVYLLRALCRIHNDDFRGAVADYDKVLQEKPDEQGALYNRALCHLELQQPDEAADDLDRLLRKWGNFYRAYMVRAQVELMRGDTLQALRWADSLLLRQPETADAWSFKGRYALSEENYTLADSCLTKAIAYDPDNHENYIARAQARHGLNRFGGALADYDKTIELVPQHFVAHYNRGLLRALLGDNNRAIEDFDFVLQLEPDNTLARYNRAQLREAVGDLRGAVQDYTELLREYPNFTYGYYARGALRRRIGDTRGAIADETRVARAGLDLVYRPGARKSIKKVRKRSDHSLESYRQLVEEEPDTTRSYVSELFGKVQNRPADKKLLPPFAFTATRAAEGGYHSICFITEAEALNAARDPLPLTLAAGKLEREHASGLPQYMGDGVSEDRYVGESSAVSPIEVLRQSALKADAYDYQGAFAICRTASDSLLSEENPPAPLSTPEIRLLLLLQRGAMAYLLAETPVVVESPAYREAVLREGQYAVDQALALHPDLPCLLYNRAVLYYAMGNAEAAIADLQTALRLDARFAEAYYNLGVIYLREGQAEKAIPVLSKAGEMGIYKAYALIKDARRKSGAN